MYFIYECSIVSTQIIIKKKWEIRVRVYRHFLTNYQPYCIFRVLLLVLFVQIFTKSKCKFYINGRCNIFIFFYGKLFAVDCARDCLKFIIQNSACIIKYRRINKINNLYLKISNSSVRNRTELEKSLNNYTFI